MIYAICFRYLLLLLVGTYYLFVGSADGEVTHHNISCEPLVVRYSAGPLKRLEVDLEIVNLPCIGNTPINGMGYSAIAYTKEGDQYDRSYTTAFIATGAKCQSTISIDNIDKSSSNTYIAYCLYSVEKIECDLYKDKIYTFIFLQYSEDGVTDVSDTCLTERCEITLDLNNYCKNAYETKSAPENKTASVVVGEIGKSLSIPCPVSDYPRSSITWFTPSGERADSNNSNKYEVRGNELLIKSLSIDMLGKYRCEVNDLKGLRTASWTVLVERSDPDWPESPFPVEHTTASPRTDRPAAAAPATPRDSPPQYTSTNDRYTGITVWWWLVGLLVAVSLALATVFRVVVKHYKRTARVQRQTIHELVEKVEGLEAERRLAEEMRNRAECPLPEEKVEGLEAERRLAEEMRTRAECPLPEETYDQVYAHGAGLKRPRRCP